MGKNREGLLNNIERDFYKVDINNNEDWDSKHVTQVNGHKNSVKINQTCYLWNINFKQVIYNEINEPYIWISQRNQIQQREIKIMKSTSLRPILKYEKEAKYYEINKPYVQQRKIIKLLIKSNCYEFNIKS